MMLEDDGLNLSFQAIHVVIASALMDDDDDGQPVS